MRVIIYSRRASSQCGSQVEVLRKTIERRGDKIVGFVADDPKIIGRGKYAGWRAVVSDLAQIDQIVVNSAGDLPGKSVGDLLKILATLCDHGVSLLSLQDDIDTSSGSASVLRLVAAYRFVKRSEAIRAGQATARAAGKRLGRPAVPERVRREIRIALINGDGIRPTARRFNVSPGSIVNIWRMLSRNKEKLAA